MPTDPTFAEIVRQVAAEHEDVADYKALSQIVLEEIEGRERDLLARLLPGYMRAVLSRRQEGSAEAAWGAFLDERVPNSEGDTVFVREATADDLAGAVERRKRFAGNLDRRAQQFAAVENQMRAVGAKTVAGLPVTTGADTLGRLEVTLAIEKARRVKAEKRRRALGALRQLRDNLEGLLAAEEDTLVDGLRRRKAQLVSAIEAERETIIRIRIFHELQLELMQDAAG